MTERSKALINFAGQIVTLNLKGAYNFANGDLISPTVSNLGENHMFVSPLPQTTRDIVETANELGMHKGITVFQSDGKIPLVFTRRRGGQIDPMVQADTTKLFDPRSMVGNLKRATSLINFHASRLTKLAAEKDLFPCYIKPGFLVTSILATLAPTIDR